MYVNCSVLNGINKMDKLKTVPQGRTREASGLSGLKVGILGWVPSSFRYILASWPWASMTRVIIPSCRCRNCPSESLDNLFVTLCLIKSQASYP